MKKVFTICILAISFSCEKPIAIGNLPEMVERSGIVEGFFPETLSDFKKRDLYKNGWIDFNKNNKKDVYEDPTALIENRLKDLLSQMTLEEKSCQLATLYGYKRFVKDPLPNNWNTKIWKDGIANIDQHLDRGDYNWPPSLHAKAINENQRFFVEDTRLGIPVDFSVEGIHGVFFPITTNFPAPLSIGSTWDETIAYQVAKSTASEAKALGFTNVYSPILDLARDPRWGRARSCYSEDPFLTSYMGVATVEGIQNMGVVATAKHFAVYGVPKGGRDHGVRKDPFVAKREMLLHLEPFKQVVLKANILGMMITHNDYDGTQIIHNRNLLTDLIVNQWGFKGYSVSDSGALKRSIHEFNVVDTYQESVRKALEAGLNVRTDFADPEEYIKAVRELVNDGEISEERIDQLVSGVLRVKFWLGLFDNPYTINVNESDKIVGNSEHRDTALNAARKAIVLLKNEYNVLPIESNQYKKILITGPGAKDKGFMSGAYGPTNGKVISVYEGIKAIAKNKELRYTKGCDFTDANFPKSEIMETEPKLYEVEELKKAKEMAEKVDLAIVVVGDSRATAGESSSRTNLNLAGLQQQLIKTIYKTGVPTIVVLVSGRPASINWTAEHIPGILFTSAGGEFHGQAIAEALFGKINPGGKLPVTFPRTVGQIPLAFPSRATSNYGQRWNTQKWETPIGKSRVLGPLYPFGYGLSYSKFDYGKLVLEVKNDTTLTASVEVTNVSDISGDEVVQLYIKDEIAEKHPYEIELKGFKRITLKPKETKKVNFELNREHFEVLKEDYSAGIEPGNHTVFIGTSSEEIKTKGRVNIQMNAGIFTIKKIELVENNKAQDIKNRHSGVYRGPIDKFTKTTKVTGD